MRHSHIVLRIGLLMLGVVLLSTTASHAASMTARVESVQTAPGELAEIPITVEESPGMVAMHLEVTYDPAILEMETVEPGGLAEGTALMEFNTEEAGRLVISLAAAREIEGDGTLAIMHFNVSGEEGQTTSIGLENGLAWDETGVDIIVNTEAGAFTVGPAGPSLILLLAVLAVALILLLLIVMRRRRQPAMADGPQQPQPASSAGGGKAQFCGKCGSRVQAGNEFCTNCGQRIAS